MGRAVKTTRKRRTEPKAVLARNFPAWIDGETRPIVPTVIVEHRVRDSLVLRTVAQDKLSHPKGTSDVRRAS